MGETIGTIETHGLNLQVGNSPLTITGTGGVEVQTGTAIFGSAASPWTIANAGTIDGSGPQGIGIDLQDASFITNTGTIEGGEYGVRIREGSATIVNSGTIAGGRDAIVFQGTYADRLIIDPGAVFVGQVVGSTLPGASNALELAGAGVIGTLSNFGSQLVNFGTLQVDASASWVINASDTITGAVDIYDYGTLTNTATIAPNGFSIEVEAGGVLVNSGTLTSSADAVRGVGAGITLTNSGTISGIVQLSQGGLVTNQAGGLIEAINNAITSSPSTMDTIVNAGTIRGVRTGAAPVSLKGVDTIVNSGTIVGGFGGTGVILGQGGVVVNSGVIGGVYYNVDTGSFGTQLAAYGLTVQNGASTITNSGTIQGSVDAINFAAGTAAYNGRLIVDPGAVFVGTVAGGTAATTIVLENGGTTVEWATNMLELAAGPTPGGVGTITGFDSQFTHFGSLQIDSGATWAVSGSSAGSGVELAGPHADRLVLEAGGTLIASSVTAVGGGVIELAAGATPGLGDTLSNFGSQLIGFGTLQVDAGANWVLDASDTIAGAVDMYDYGTLTNTASITPNGFNGAIALESGGVLVNSGTITGFMNAVFGVAHVGGAAGIILANSGTIEGAVVLDGGGLISNQAGGVIEAFHSFDAISSAVNTSDTIVNAGTIRTNFNGGGVSLEGSDTVVNTGTIDGGLGGTGVILNQGGVVLNSGLLGGFYLEDTGLAVKNGAATITNAGTIQGSTDAINFAAGTAGYADRLIVDPGAVFIGTVVGGTAAGATNVLELAAGPAPGAIGTITGFGAQFTHFGSIQIDSGAAWAVSGTFSTAETISLSGTNVSFAFDAGSAFAPTISSFNNTDTLDVRDVVANGATIVGDNTLDLTENGAVIATLTLGPFPNGAFAAMSDGSGGTDVNFSSGGSYMGGAPCYCRGTRILTDEGEVAVEDLRIGDRLVTAFGEVRPIVWIGRRSYDGQFAKGKRNLLPVLIRAGALEDGVPRRDLWVSPLHAMFLDAVLIAAADLVNGISVVQPRTVDRVEYFHVELAIHDIIFAEGAASESFVDDDSRCMFHNAAEFRTLYPESAPNEALYCAPRVEEGEQLEEVRRSLAERAGQMAVAKRRRSA